MPDEVDPDDAFEPQVFAAYKRAWRRRKSRGGLDSATVLQEEFDRAGYEPDEDEWALWQSAWSAAVPPRRISWFLTKQVGAEFMSLARDIGAIINDPELPEWLLPPPGKRLLSVGWVSGDVKKQTLIFRPDVESPETLERCRTLTKGKVPSCKVRVWLQLGRDYSTVPVMVGQHRVGWTSVEASRARKLRRKPWHRKTKVPDGTLKITFNPDETVSFGKLRVHLPGGR